MYIDDTASLISYKKLVRTCYGDYYERVSADDIGFPSFRLKLI